MTRFRNRQINLLVATDVAARGLDVTDLTHVINYDLPDEPEAYVHRSGRTGRAGKTGECICILDKRDIKRLHFISRKTGIKFNEAQLPEQSEIFKQKVDNTLNGILSTEVKSKDLLKLLPEVDQMLFHLSRQELIGRFLSLILKDDLPTGNTNSRKSDTGRNVSSKRDNTYIPDMESDQEFTRFYINLGTKHQLDKSSLIGLINRYMKGSDFAIGKIEMLKSFSFFEIEAGLEDRVLSGFRKAEYEQQKLMVEKSLPKPEIRTKEKHKKKKRKKF